MSHVELQHTVEVGVLVGVCDEGDQPFVKRNFMHLALCLCSDDRWRAPNMICRQVTKRLQAPSLTPSTDVSTHHATSNPHLPASLIRYLRHYASPMAW